MASAGVRRAVTRRGPMTLAEAGPGTENERLGVVRLSMLRNPLILKPELGKPKRNCYPLPGPDFTYGMYMHRRDGGVPEAIGHWESVKAKPCKRVMPRDFVAMSRGAVAEGCTTAREFALYYKFKDTRQTDKRILRYGSKTPPGMTFGRPSRPPTPFFDIMQHRYKELWMEQQRAQTIVQRQVKKKLQSGKVRENRTSFLRAHPLPVKEESFWHPQRYEKAEPHLRTFPDPESRKKALRASH
ncbi:cilia- and flagella-associated protein 77 [Chamaea fasciata]|uniref:cilia- and flagella-associated protein 77 n=1 Tax=Chamaea fasciata TaxID=190680 RepID=UPI00336A694B